MGFSDYITRGKDAVVAAGSMVNDGVRGPNAGFGSGALTTIGTIGFAKKTFDVVNHTGQALGVVSTGVDESGKPKEAPGVVTILTDVGLATLAALAVVKGASMGRGT